MKKLAAMAMLGLMAAATGAVPAQVPDAPPPAAESADKVTMRLALTPRQFSMRMSTVLKTTETINSRVQETNVSNATALRVNVAGVYPDGSMALDVTVTAFKADVKSPLFTGAVDTSTPNVPAAPMLKHWLQVPGSMYRVTVTPDGSVKSVEGIELIQQKLVASIDPSVSAMRPMLEPEIQQAWSTDGIKKLWEGFFDFYADQPVGAGDIWTKSETEDAGPLARASSTQYVSRERKGGYTLIEFTTTATPHPNPPEVETMPGMKFRPTVSGGAKGTITLHEQTGWPYSMNYTARFNNLVKLAAAMPGLPAEIPVTIDIQNTMETAP
jgi:hypothetical protein